MCVMDFACGCKRKGEEACSDKEKEQYLRRSRIAWGSLEVRKVKIPRIMKLGGVSPGWQRAVITTACRIM